MDEGDSSQPRGEAATNKTAWGSEEWEELAGAFTPSACRAKEKKYLRDLLHAADDRRLGALPAIWQLQSGFKDEEFQEEVLHNRLEELEPTYKPLLDAIRAYEAFARSLQDAFDVLKAEAALRDAQGFLVTEISRDADFKRSTKDLHRRFEAAHRALSEVSLANASLQTIFQRRFEMFAEPMDAGTCALALCTHHKAVQQAKSAEGKRPWFDNISQDRIYIRYAYREPRRDIQPGRYVHDYRGDPIRRFWSDLS